MSTELGFGLPQICCAFSVSHVRPDLWNELRIYPALTGVSVRHTFDKQSFGERWNL